MRPDTHRDMLLFPFLCLPMSSPLRSSAVSRQWYHMKTVSLPRTLSEPRDPLSDEWPPKTRPTLAAHAAKRRPIASPSPAHRATPITIRQEVCRQAATDAPPQLASNSARRSHCEPSWRTAWPGRRCRRPPGRRQASKLWDHLPSSAASCPGIHMRLRSMAIMDHGVITQCGGKEEKRQVGAA